MTGFHDIKKKIVLFSGDILLILACAYLAVFMRLRFMNVLHVYTAATTFALMLYPLSFYIFDLYSLDQKFKTISNFIRFTFAFFTASLTLAIIFYLFPNWKFGRGIFVIYLILVFLSVWLWRNVFFAFYANSQKIQKVVIVGAGYTGATMYDALVGNNSFNILGFLDDDSGKTGKKIGEHVVLGTAGLLQEMAEKREIDIAVVAVKGQKSSGLLKNLLKAKILGVEIYNMPSFYEELTVKLPVSHIHDSWLVDVPFYGLKRGVYVDNVKRFIDICLSVTGFFLTWPVFVIAAVAIRLGSKGPVFLRQKRVGLNEKVYELVKFRSMKNDAEASGAVWAQKDDPRITKVGKFMRRTRIDEMPQIWNVIKGEMSFIGPRPERPEFVEGLNREIPFYSLRHSIKPGITGWAQVNYRYGASTKDALEKLQYDLFYIKNLSFFLDLFIAIKTIKVVFMGKGAR